MMRSSTPTVAVVLIISLVIIFMFRTTSARAHVEKNEIAVQITCGDLVVIALPPTQPVIAHVAAMAQCLGAQPLCTVKTVRLLTNTEMRRKD